MNIWGFSLIRSIVRWSVRTFYLKIFTCPILWSNTQTTCNLSVIWSIIHTWIYFLWLDKTLAGCSIHVHIFSSLHACPYIGTQLCRQGGNLFLGSVQLPAQLADLRTSKWTTSNSTNTKSVHTGSIKACNAKRTHIHTHASRCRKKTEL